MGHASLSGKCFSLLYSKPVLLIGDHQRQAVVIHRALDQRVGSDDDPGIPALDPVIGPPLLLRRHRAGEQFHLHRDPIFLQ